MLADILTISEKIHIPLEQLKLAYCGDLNNNVTYDLMRLGSVIGFTVHAAGPTLEGYAPEESVLTECRELCKQSGGNVKIFSNV